MVRIVVEQVAKDDGSPPRKTAWLARILQQICLSRPIQLAPRKEGRPMPCGKMNDPEEFSPRAEQYNIY
jgi:hypothetical protein